MADNVTITAGSGTTIATDDIGAGVQVQRVKVTWGADGIANDTSAANPLPITAPSAIPVSGTAKLGAYGTKTDVLTTELNSLASAGVSSAGTAYDNSTTLYPQCDVRLTVATQGTARSTGATVAVYMTTRLDGSAFDDASASTAELVAVFPLDAATTARVATRRGVSLPPEQVKFFATNNTGQAFAASGTSVSVRPYYTATT